jgi:hypothetical protein
MNRSAPNTGASLRAYPNIAAAAKILDVSPSTLSRREDLAAESRGARDMVLPATEVLRLAKVYRRRSVNDVAQDLIDLAAEASPEEATQVDQEIEAWFEGGAITDADRARFLDLAAALLPPSLYATVKESLEEQVEALPDAVVGNHPLP